MQILLVFFLYAFLGWALEVAYYAVKEKRFVNRGFLHGPFVPIYGLSLAVIHLLIGRIFPGIPPYGFIEVFTVFALVVMVSTLLELFGGIMLMNAFEARWWDYSTNRFNYRGYICLKFSLIWGGVGTATILGPHLYVAQPLLAEMDPRLRNVLALSLLTVLFLDATATVFAMAAFKRLLRQIRHNAKRLHETSESLNDAVRDFRFQAFRSHVGTFLNNLRKNERIASLKEGLDRIRNTAKNLRQKRVTQEFESLTKIMRRITENRLYRAFPDVRMNTSFKNEGDKKKEEEKDADE